MMAVYIDDAYLPFGRMIMCHMTSETVEELQQFADWLGLKRTWFQDHRIPHYDVSKQVRAHAVALGAIEVQYGWEPWRCDECKKSKLPCTKRLRCACPSPADTQDTPPAPGGSVCGGTSSSSIQ